MAATAESQPKVEQKVTLQTPSKSSDDNVFSAWRNSKDTMNPQAGASTNRRMSTMRGMKSMLGMRRLTLTMRAKSDVSADQLKPQPKKENTYKMKPDTGSEFSVAKVTNVVKQVFEDMLDDFVYDHDVSSKITCMLAERVKDRVKELNFPRYKIAANVMLGQAGDQGLEVASRCCWDHTTDTYACVTHKTKTVFAIALVYGVYYE